MNDSMRLRRNIQFCTYLHEVLNVDRIWIGNDIVATTYGWMDRPRRVGIEAPSPELKGTLQWSDKNLYMLPESTMF